MRSLAYILLPAVALSACARTETPEEARAAAVEAQAEYARLAAEARAGVDEEEVLSGTSPGQIDTSGSGSLTPGSWSVATVDGERMARFGEEGEAPIVSIACETGGGVDVRLIGMVPQGGSGTVFINTPEGGSTFIASEGVGDVAEAYISVPAADPFIGRLISGSGPYAIRMGGDQQLTIPADDVLTSVVSSCDRRDTPVATTDLGAAAVAENAGEAEE
ncbi:hypothetical protein [Parasphingopyxis lamellibrachiae]|uniref:Uncharacterized protein n=1 Tax=Parasphingopyxis lamellibrachiae TaxID=680125 RepID=A0A3D9FII5_9SPHN|nr:hypothetical protein [Parasphingopyxis lamellibrachiae]RED16896.1 hypothetical protein DFR46_1930 [Parasphingopyxis lamellibrachiae]